VSILHHHHVDHPLDDTFEMAERRQMIVRCNDLTAANAEKDRTIAHLRAEIARLESRRRRRK
jgi:uncharacterized small protein (DUF1192 family)